jgi:integrase/predicted RNA-binding Zn-ribbon protein involved in translation (DUF1610 family)
LAELPQQKCTQKNSSPKYESPKCPECGSRQIWKDGIRYTTSGKIQRYLCRECGYRFSEPNVKVNVTSQTGELLHPGANLTEQMVGGGKTISKKSLDSSFLFRSENVRPHNSKPQSITTAGKDLNAFLHYTSDCQVCVDEKKMKNLVKVETRQKQAAGATKLTEKDIEGKIINCLWNLKKAGCYAESTIKHTGYILRRLQRICVNLLEPEEIKEILASHDEWSQTYKQSITAAYARFTTFLGIPFEKPHYKPPEKLPFIPTEKEIDQLIAACGSITSTFLRLLKETGIRSGEASKLKWSTIDFERKTLRVVPEKHGRARELRISDTLIAMFNRLPKDSQKVFRSTAKTMRCSFAKQRKRIALKLNNPRINQVHFHTLRHWRATMEYQRTKSILQVQQMLGHRNIKNTMVYTHLINFEANSYISRVAKNAKGARALTEAGFEYVCTTPEGLMLFKKPK